MGNYRFRLSDMIPNAWFYKLKDMNKSRNQNSMYHGSKKKLQQTSSSSSSSSATAALPSKERQSQLSNQRKSYYFSRDLTAATGDEHEHGIFYDNVETKTRISDSNYSEPPRKSSKKRRSTRRNRVSNRSSPRVVTSSVTAGCSCRATVESVWTKPDSTPEEYPISPLDSSSDNEAPLADEFGSKSNCCVAPETFDGILSWSASSRCRHEKDIIMDIEKEPLNEKCQEPTDKVDGLDTVSELNLPPIITNPSKSSRKTMETLPTEPKKIRRSSAKLEERNAHGSLSVKVVKEDILNTSPKEQKTIPARKFSSNSQGLKLRTNSPRIASRKIQGRKSVSSSSSASSRRTMSESFAVVKSSKDPQRDFRDSMVEMIIENNISASKDLEDLLACYLSLNSDEYHDLIIRVFKQIWFDIVDIHSK